jgi:UDP-2-acetamido-3-amino-2,3-dideoxy-glucuronate N-acetyltransferase
LSSKKNICVVGAGQWGMNHIRTLDELGALGGVVDIDSERLEIAQKTFPEIQTFTSVEDAIEYGFDGYTVVTSPTAHYTIGKAILEAGYPVLIEKPMALEIEQAEELVELAESKNLPLMVGHLLLFHPAIRKIKELISKGRIGHLQYLYSNRLNLGQVRTEENVLWSLAPHDLSVFEYLIDKPPIEVATHGASFITPRIHDTTITILKYPGNVMGHIFVNWLHPFKEHRLVIVGSEGMITFVDSEVEKPLKLYDKTVNLKNGFPEKIDGTVKEIKYNISLPLTNELSYFLKCIDGVQPEIASGQNGLDILKTLKRASMQIES